MSYQSIFDPSAHLLAAFKRTLPVLASPTTIVLDQEGRVAARVLGVITDPQIIPNIVRNVTVR